MSHVPGKRAVGDAGLRAKQASQAPVFSKRLGAPSRFKRGPCNVNFARERSRAAEQSALARLLARAPAPLKSTHTSKHPCMCCHCAIVMSTRSVPWRYWARKLAQARLPLSSVGTKFELQQRALAVLGPQACASTLAAFKRGHQVRTTGQVSPWHDMSSAPPPSDSPLGCLQVCARAERKLALKAHVGTLSMRMHRRSVVLTLPQHHVPLLLQYFGQLFESQSKCICPGAARCVLARTRERPAHKTACAQSASDTPPSLTGCTRGCRTRCDGRRGGIDAAAGQRGQRTSWPS